jgi:CelD/BcsL family acetyltransferase involved in cellulose biosynthesis
MSLPELVTTVASPLWAEPRDRPAAVEPPLVVETVSDPAGFEALREEWTELLEASAADCLFLTWEWLHTWWRHLGDGRRPALATVRRGGRLAALAPLSLPGRNPLGAVARGSLRALGTGRVGSDYLDLVVRAGEEEAAVEALAGHLAGRRAVVELRQVPRGASTAGAVAERLRRRGWRSIEQVTHVCPWVEAGGTWEGYLASLGSSHRANFRRRLRRLHRDFEVRFERVDSEAGLDVAFDALLALHHLRWRDRGGSDAFDDPALIRFHREMTRVALGRGWLRLHVLRLDGRPAAALYGFLYRGRFLYYQSGFDPDYSDWAVGLVTMGLAIRAAIADGAAEIDLLHGGESYKFLWADRTRELVRLELYPPSPSGLVRLGLRRGVRRAKDRLRGWLGIPGPAARRPAGGGGAPRGGGR